MQFGVWHWLQGRITWPLSEESRRFSRGVTGSEWVVSESKCSSRVTVADGTVEVALVTVAEGPVAVEGITMSATPGQGAVTTGAEVEAEASGYSKIRFLAADEGPGVTEALEADKFMRGVSSSAEALRVTLASSGTLQSAEELGRRGSFLMVGVEAAAGALGLAVLAGLFFPFFLGEGILIPLPS